MKKELARELRGYGVLLTNFFMRVKQIFGNSTLKAPNLFSFYSVLASKMKKELARELCGPTWCF